MQLDKLVSFHKALADVNRVKIITLLKQGPLHGQAIAGKLGLKPPTITHHVRKLREVGLIRERREKNTIYFHLDEKKLELMSTAILSVVDKQERPSLKRNENYEIVRNFLTLDGKLKQLPSQQKKKILVLAHFIQQLEIGKTYPEAGINAFIQSFYEDYATIRREFIMNHFMYREEGMYMCNPKEMWPVEV
ncbi:metalloregulator ArsR/SmtB family transcription factor [Bacillus solimangrovi]|uniref:ArsR family transcriptional regulator n=1 Tax=Bacillus solimangrovi TaxID=1305675 RepID=A0A1E5LFJ4_9BACI|nr:metalloregulator ArsR/SmtB family transcription factor [Bacillus solimangrovi]OEH92826.1 ArsR family transcriptional regulator [Bacillus solimangrovi]